ncbi:conserved hypothetical protein [Alteracholeplasma palmae J233]|uniref:NAD(P)-binding domain-containing protein n=1 Tax=Alteracholeplasma palmae (strain ATCC 49389 / J233) TaxID=1318466 RepID=U4KRR9_ALTPJ|nr:NAD(P)H-binding protein [Alteracholeplasma palmae]CCV64401.1 conserved hypothetical protein [Alteracholeplasma palmae J233]
MKIAVIGASGFTGKAVVFEALKNGHSVYAVSRSGKFEPQANLTVIHENVNHVDALSEKIKDADLIISSFNAGWENPNLYNDFLEGSRSIIKMARNLDKRLVIIGGASSLYDPRTNETLYANASKEMKQMVKGAYDLYQELKEDKSVKWTFVSPAIELNDNKPTYTYNIGSDYILFNQEGKSTVSIFDLADLTINAAASDLNIYKRLTLSDR